MARACSVSRNRNFGRPGSEADIQGGFNRAREIFRKNSPEKALSRNSTWHSVCLSFAQFSTRLQSLAVRNGFRCLIARLQVPS
jgi:hypothetical protein